jgi:hypothetical protein
MSFTVKKIIFCINMVCVSWAFLDDWIIVQTANHQVLSHKSSFVRLVIFDISSIRTEWNKGNYLEIYQHAYVTKRRWCFFLFI